VRREVILLSVIDLLASQGLEGVTHRAVDAAAGLPQGSTAYSFPRRTGCFWRASS